jgi:hypothetical protein
VIIGEGGGRGKIASEHKCSPVKGEKLIFLNLIVSTRGKNELVLRIENGDYFFS